MDSNLLRPPGGVAGQPATVDNVQTSIELNIIPSEEATSSASSLSASNTPPSTPATSIRPSSHSSEDSPTSRPILPNQDSAQLATNGRAGDLPGQQLDPVPEGEIDSSYYRTDGPNQYAPTTSIKAALQKLSAWHSALRSHVSRWDSFQTFMGLVVSILAVITFAFSYRSYELAKWESWHDFRDDCAADDARRKTEACKAFLSRPLVEPPYQSNSGFRRLAVRTLKPAVKLSLHIRYSNSLIVWFCLASVLAMLYTLLRPRAPINFEESQGRSRPLAPWEFIPPSLLRRLRYTNAPAHETSPPVRLGIPWSTSIQTSETDGQGRRRYIFTMPDDPEARKRTFQDRISDLWFNPTWRRNGTLPVVGGQEKVHEQDKRRTGSANIHERSPSGDHNSNNSTHETISSFRSKIRRRIPRLDSSSSSDSDSAPFSALAGNSEKNFSSEPYKSGTRLRIKSGTVSLGIAQSGAKIASAFGGEAGQELLVHEVSADGVDVPLPQAPQDISIAT